MPVIGATIVEMYESGWEDRMRCSIDPATHELTEFGDVLQYRPDVIDEDETYWEGNRIDGDDGFIYALIPDYEYEDARRTGADVWDWFSAGVSGFVVVDADDMSRAWTR